MANLVSTSLTLVFVLAAAASLSCIPYLTQDPIPPYPYIWGWINAGRLGVADIMIYWTFVVVGAVTFPLIVAAVGAPALITQTGNSEWIGQLNQNFRQELLQPLRIRSRRAGTCPLEVNCLASGLWLRSKAADCLGRPGFWVNKLV